MKVAIGYPPLGEEKGVPLLAQNRQFQWFCEPTYIYPMVPASAATLLNQNGFDVAWLDGIAGENTYEQWLTRLEQASPDILALETKTPVVRHHWELIKDIKERLDTRIVLMGDHVTAFPEESLEKSPVDYVVTGGDYDFLLDSLSRHLRDGSALEPGIFWRGGNTGQFVLDHDLSTLPMIDRDLTQWKLYSEKNGNYKVTPGTYTMVARDCWWHRCTFCSWTTLYPKYRARRPEQLVEEIGNLITRYRVKEIMDDSGSFPIGKWLETFCNGIIEKGYPNEIRLDCNMRFGACSLEQYRLMRKAGFRFVLFGLESGNQTTLDRLDKGLTVDEIISSCRKAKQAGLNPHITIMFGYPWETMEDVQRTVKLGKYLMKKGYADTLQATVVIPYPGTPLFKECKEQGILKTEDWDRYDMKEPVMKTPIPEEELLEAVQSVYKVAFDPEFIVRKVIGIRSVEDVRFIVRAGKKVIGHVRDFKGK
jgi:radical SAM superfamily enzyme YgiQ (UPF0313 family)